MALEITSTEQRDMVEALKREYARQTTRRAELEAKITAIEAQTEPYRQELRGLAGYEATHLLLNAIGMYDPDWVAEERARGGR